jgi:hypothetical protein
MLAEIERESAGKQGADLLAARMRAGARYRQRLAALGQARAPQGADASSSSSADAGEMGGLSWVSFHPSLASRLTRLRAMGAHVSDPDLGRPRRPLQTVVLLAFGLPIGALIAVLLGIVVVLATGLTVLFMMIPMAVVYAVFEWLF